MEKFLNVEETKTRLIFDLSIITGFKYLKSGILKKTIKDIVFEINFFGRFSGKKKRFPLRKIIWMKRN